MTAIKMSPLKVCGFLVALLLVTGSLRAEEGYGSGRPAAVGGGNYAGYAGGGNTNSVVGPSGGGAGGYGGNNGYNNGGGASAPGGSYDGGELGEPHPYSFQYEVKDPPSGNDYSQQESSDGNTVTGEYQVLLPDGRRQVVKYSANDQTGFVADVQYEGEANFLQPSGPGQQQQGFDNNQQGGYNNQQLGQGGYNNNNQGGYDGNNQQGGYNNQQQGGYNNQQQGQGGYSYRR